VHNHTIHLNRHRYKYFAFCFSLVGEMYAFNYDLHVMNLKL